MGEQFTFTWLLIRRLLLMMAAYSIYRLLFIAFNYHLFKGATTEEWLIAFVQGWRFDMVVIIYVNALVIVLHLLPFNFRYKRGYQSMIMWIYFTTNFAALFFALIDLEWFGVVEKRMTFGIFRTANYMIDQLPAYLLGYWYLLVLYILTISATIWCYRRIRFRIPEQKVRINYAIQITLLISFLGLSIIGSRGGLQHKPLIPINAAYYSGPSLAQVTLNTPFNILLTAQLPELIQRDYFDKETLKRKFNIQHDNSGETDPIRKENVVIIIWESLSRNFVGVLNQGTGFTPFLDSLASNGLLCINANANAHSSIEGVPAVVASIPTLMNESFTISDYQQDRFNGLASVLKKSGYETEFFHGGKNGIMSFDALALAAGYDRYYGLNEYPDLKDYDGMQGIWDEPYLLYVANQLSEMKQPFCATVFTLSSHFPFKVPSQYEEIYKLDKRNSYYQLMQYTDHALKQFFEMASKQTWYSNTLFVIVADHGAWDPTPSNSTPHGRGAIPILFFKPDGSLRGIYSKPTQQVDIMPSVIDYLNIPCRYVSFGKSIFSNDSSRYVFNYFNGIYYIEDNRYDLAFDGSKSLGLYDYRSDTLFTQNLLTQLPQKTSEMENQLKAIIEVYNDALINNKLMPEE